MENNYFQYSAATYELKPGTKAQFYYQEGSKILPERISIGKSFVPIKQSNQYPVRLAELKGTYKKTESGKYSRLNTGNSIHTGIFPSPVKLFYGYGILDERHHIYDLLLFEEITPPLRKFRIYFLEGHGVPQKIMEAIRHMEEIIKKEGPR